MRQLATAVSVLLVLFLCACATAPNRKPEGPLLEPYTTDEIKATATQLMDRAKLTEGQRTILTERLDGLLADPAFAAQTVSPGVTAVGVFRAGGGGFVIRGGSGAGFASFNGGGQEVPIIVGGMAIGAIIGGGSTQGLFLAVGLEHENMIAGQWDGAIASATAGKSSVRGGQATRDGDDVVLRYFATGTGLSAEWGGGSYTVEFRKNIEGAADAAADATAEVEAATAGTTDG